MKLFLFCGVIAAMSLAQAIQFKISGAKNQILFQTEIEVAAVPTDVGSISIDILNQNQIPYEGSRAGISSIMNLASDMVVISDTEMKAYGWCFSIDGEAPDTMPDDTKVLDPHSNIEWYYAYAHYKNGNWAGVCVRD